MKGSGFRVSLGLRVKGAGCLGLVTCFVATSPRGSAGSRRSRSTDLCNPRTHATYRGNSPIKNTPLLGPYSRTMPRALRWGGPRGEGALF